MVLLTKTAIKLGDTTLTSVVDTNNNNTSSINLNVVDSSSVAYTFAEFHGANSTLELLQPDGTKGVIDANVSASSIDTETISVTNKLSLTDASSLEFSGPTGGSILHTSSLGVNIEGVVFNSKELTADNLVLTGTTSLALKSDTLVLGSAADVGGQIISAPNKITIDPSPLGIQGELVINGDLTVRGTQTSVNSTTIELGDSTLELIGSAVTPSGIHIKIGSDERRIVWEETTSTWKLVDNNNNLLNLTAGVFHGEATTVSTLNNFTTDDLTEGANLYYTDARVNTQIDSAFLAKSTTDLSEGANLYWTQTRFNTAFAAKNTDSLAEGSSHLYWSEGRFNTSFAGKSTTDLVEGVNLYYTPARVNTLIDAAFVAKDTSDLSEGSNLYHTAARVNTLIDAAFVAKSTTDLSEGSNLYHTAARVNTLIDAAFVAKSTTDLSEGANLYYTDARAKAAMDSQLTTKTTDDLAEGSYNLYFTDARAKAAISAGTGVTVSSGEVNLGGELKKKTVVPSGTDTENLFSLLTGGSTPFSNTSAGGAVTLYVSASNAAYTSMSMGVYHAVLINGLLNVVSQLEVNHPGGGVYLNVDENNNLTTTNNGNVDVYLSLRAVLQFDNQLHLV